MASADSPPHSSVRRSRSISDGIKIWGNLNVNLPVALTFLTTALVNIDAGCAELGVHLSGTGSDYKGQSCLFALKQNGAY